MPQEVSTRVLNMRTLHTTARAGEDGVLHLDLPLGSAGIEYDIVVVLNPKPEKTDRMSWAEFIDRTAGSIEDETFRRHEQGGFEERLEF